jgi:3-hydroxyacyl-CoA dehydrogenase
MISDYSAEIGARRRSVDEEEIVQRLIFDLVNRGAAILEEGIELRASDIDVLNLKGYGFPRHRGGPMFYADEVGLYNVIGAMARFAANPHGDPGFWKPAPLLARLAAEGKRFN